MAEITAPEHLETARGPRSSGGSEDGAPGVRSEYDVNYYGAFVRDPDGNKIEAVTYASR